MKKILLSFAVLSAAMSSYAVMGTIKSKGDSKRGDITWNIASKSYSLKAGNASVSYPLKDIDSLEIDKPANFDKLVALVAKNNGAAAEAGFLEIIKKYKMLQWDKPAARYLMEVYTQTGRYQKAYDIARPIIDGDATAAYKSEMAPAYWQVLIALKNKDDQLNNCLRMAVSEGGRAISAEALLARGDIIVEKGGKSPNAYRQALIDSYLKVALMYNDAECIETRKKAMLKSADAFDKIGYAEKAQEFRAVANKLVL